MPFIWRQKSTAESHTPLDDEALSCLEAGYILINIDNGSETCSHNLHTVMGLGSPVQSTDEMRSCLTNSGSEQLSHALAAIRKGQVVAPVMLEGKQDNRYFACRTYVPPSGDSSHLGVLWIYDISSEGRLQQRMLQENEKLKSEIKTYSTILNMAPYPIWQRDGSLKIRYYNLAYSEIAEASDIVSDEAPELDRRARILATQALQSGEPKKERRHIVVDGERCLFEIQELPLAQEQIVVGCAQNITEIEQYQSELERYISAQGDLLESSASAMAVFGSDMRLKTFNYAYVSLWKLEEKWLETQPSYSEILEVLREKRCLPEQANFAHFKQQQLKLFTDLIDTHEEFYYLPDGTALRVIVIPHALGGLLFAYEDVTDRLTLERSYNTLIAVQRETLDNLHEGVAVFGEDGKLRLSNPVYHSIWGIPPELGTQQAHISEILEHIKHLYQYDNWEKFKTERIALLQLRKREHRRIERKDGKVLDFTIVPLPDGASLVTYIDVTDSTLVERSLRERNEALQEADRLKSEFLANVSYELRSPLTSISGFAEMLHGEYFGELNEKQKEYIEGIQQSSQHLMQLVNDILDLASVEAGYLQLEVESFNIHTMLKSVLPLVQERAKEFNISLSLECPTRIGKMIGDDTRLKQILFKLLSNAIKFSPPDSEVVLGATDMKDTNEVIIWVRDNGYGIPQEEQDLVFNKFFKGTNEVVPKSVAKSGTGLGLSIVKNFIELHGGRVQMESAVGKGTVINCILPRENPDLKELVVKRPTRRRKSPEDSEQ